ncbi:hypothetical protein SAMN05444003_0591 [Cognatiyoonia sediminum]|uniref:Phosphatidate cytidylyltransferase n=1 Tax=Cognatiyoonia sediminum TaxID=1508389 RepID=A0A1M5M1G4_9RHOB|nr:UDP-2,3-diacylglucosamine diphosphatase LpxI [Cognatiyoonia sediminum]SHG71020.1 hypothetical protein SAMN05444003_0591 [Cognatiyoonia sediminum]
MIALIAGTGDLPSEVFKALTAKGEAPLVCAMEGFVPDLNPDITFRIEHLGSLLETLATLGIKRVCMAGAVKRPNIDPTQIDERTLPLVPRVQSAMALGDDGTLREIIAILEEFGMQVVGAAELVPELLPPEGVLTKAQPNNTMDANAMLGVQTVERMGVADSGQACVIKDRRILAEEGPDGTDAMIRRFVPTHSDAQGFGPLGMIDDLVSASADWLTGIAGTGKGAMLYKAPKPQQDRRADLPVIGPETALVAAEAGFAGIIIEQGGVMVLDRETVVQTLDANDMFLWVRA